MQQKKLCTQIQNNKRMEQTVCAQKSNMKIRKQNVQEIQKYRNDPKKFWSDRFQNLFLIFVFLAPCAVGATLLMRHPIC